MNRRIRAVLPRVVSHGDDTATEIRRADNARAGKKDICARRRHCAGQTHPLVRHPDQLYAGPCAGRSRDEPIGTNPIRRPPGSGDMTNPQPVQCFIRRNLDLGRRNLKFHMTLPACHKLRRCRCLNVGNRSAMRTGVRRWLGHATYRSTIASSRLQNLQ